MYTTTDHFLQLGIMLTVVLGAQALARRANARRLRAETQRLRVVLAIGLAAQRQLIEDNLRILAGRDQALVSGRNQISLLRTQLGRLVTLEPNEVEAVMSACVAAERVESDIAATARRADGALRTLPPQDPSARRLLEATLQAARAMLLDAEQLLRPGPAPDSAPESAATDAASQRSPAADDTVTRANA